MTNHECHAGCGRKTERRNLMCQKCWSKVPPELRPEVIKAYNFRSRAMYDRKTLEINASWQRWAAACVAAIEAVNASAPELAWFKRVAAGQSLFKQLTIGVPEEVNHE